MRLSDENVKLLAFVCRSIAWCLLISLVLIGLCGCGKTMKIRTTMPLASGAVAGACGYTLTTTGADTAWIKTITDDGWIIVRYE